MRDRRLDENEGGPEERCDGLIRDALAPLKGVGMHACARTSAERRIQAALAGDAVGRSDPGRTWWRRRVSVPIPVAAGFVLFLGLLGILQLRQLSQPHTVGKPEVVSGRVAADVSGLQYYEEALYVTGVGLVNNERGYRLLKENSHEIR